MATVDIETLFGHKIRNIFNNDKYSDIEVHKRGFNSSKSIPLNSVLFIGINPSYDEKNSAQKELFYDPSINDHRYFSKFQNAAGNNIPWGHLDLLYLRETKQNLIDGIYKRNETGLSFIYEQLLISREILEISNPRVLVVCNTKARYFLGYNQEKGQHVWLGYTFEFNDDIGTYRITNEDSALKGTPVFFTSMLTGQRALDNGSFRRLEWHIKQVLKSQMANT